MEKSHAVKYSSYSLKWRKEVPVDQQVITVKMIITALKVFQKLHRRSL